MVHPPQIETAQELRFIQTASVQWGCSKPLDLRCEVKATITKDIVKRLDAKAITAKKKALLPIIPKGKGKHTIKMLHTVQAPLAITFENDFGI